MKTFETDRLILRTWKSEDVADLYKYAKDLSVGPIAGWAPHKSIDESMLVLKSYMENDNAWAIVLKENKKVIGMVKIYPDENRGKYYAKQINYALSPAYWGNGYMTEAIKRVVDFAFDELKIDLLSVFHYPQNIRSKRVIEKCGFEYEGIIEKGCKRYDGQVFDAVCYSILKDDWIKRK